MADTGTHPFRQPALQQLADVLGITLPEVTDEQRAEHRQRMHAGDGRVAELLARRAPHAA